MNKRSNFRTALTVAAFVAAGVFTSTARLHAAGPDRSNATACTALKVVYDSAIAAGVTSQAELVFSFAQSLGCAWAQ